MCLKKLDWHLLQEIRFFTSSSDCGADLCDVAWTSSVSSLRWSCISRAFYLIRMGHIQLKVIFNEHGNSNSEKQLRNKVRQKTRSIINLVRGIAIWEEKQQMCCVEACLSRNVGFYNQNSQVLARENSDW